MIDTIKIKNVNLNSIIELDKFDSKFLLADDKAIDWGTIKTSKTTYNLTSKIGVGLTNKAASDGRTISIMGWLINDSKGTIKDKKKILNSFFNPFDDLVIYADKYKIEGYAEQVIKYSTSNSENNNIICKFLVSIFCPNPLFTLAESIQAMNFDVYSKLFLFPLIWEQDKPIVMGLRQGLDDFYVENSGTLQTGCTITIVTTKEITGLSIKNATTNQEFLLKSNLVIPANKVIKICTTPNKRGIWYGDSPDELQKSFEILDLDSDWIQLVVGRNELKFSSELGSITTLKVKIEIEPLFYAMEEQ